MRSLESMMALKYKKEELENQITLMERDIEGLKKSKKILKASLKEKHLWLDNFTRQGYRYHDESRVWHFMVFPVKGIPGALDIRDVKELIEEVFSDYLKVEGKYEGYFIESVNYSERKKVWYVQIGSVVYT